MTVAKIEIANRAATKKLIFEARGGILTEEESEMLEQYLTFSARLYIGTINSKFCCAWGLVPPSLLSNQAYLWLFTTNLVEEHKFIFIRNSQRAIEEMLKEWPLITGFCDRDNDRSIRWLKRLGAIFGPPLKTMMPFEIRA